MIASPQHPYLTLEEYLHLEEQSPIKHEYIDGQIYIGFRLDATDPSPFMKIAGATSKSEIKFGISTASVKGYDMFDFKWEVEDQFWSMTIFTAMTSTVSD